MNTNFTIWACRVLCFGIFCLSSLSKLYPSATIGIQQFEESQLFPLGFSESSAMFFSRFLISLEFALGLGFLMSSSKNWITYPIALFLLLIFNTHLSIMMFNGKGSDGNCGCFGELIHMTPIQAWIKNWIAMAIIGFLIYKRNRNEKTFISSCFLITVSLHVLLSHIAPPVMSSYSQPIITKNHTQTVLIDSTEIVQSDGSVKKIFNIGLDKNKNQQLDSAETFDDFSYSKTIQSKVIHKKETKEVSFYPPQKKSIFSTYLEDVDNGKKIVCVFSPDCSHCKDISKKIAEIEEKKLKGFEICILFKEPQNHQLISDFFENMGKELPYTLVPRKEFLKFIGSLEMSSPPGIFMIWNGNILEKHISTNETLPIVQWTKKYNY
jgi:hypothetical protein